MDQIPRAVKGTVQAMIDKKDELHVQDEICKQFGESESLLFFFHSHRVIAQICWL